MASQRRLVRLRLVADRAADCAYIRRAISLRLDDELSELGQSRLARHLRDCETCGQFAVSVAALTQTVRSSGAVSPPTR
jgi:predicted anti-sigma-YlaC factor YlaD